MNDQEQDQLLREILADDVLAVCRDRSLVEAQRAMRQRKRHQRLARIAVVASLPLLGVVLFLSQEKDTRTARSIPAPAQSNPVRSQPADPGVRFISDEELLNLFPDRPVALIGQPGRQTLAFLDERGLKGSRH
jgi:hypothetical protein